MDQGFRHIRDSSYDSFDKESIDSLDEAGTDHTSMPMSRYSSGSALHRNRDHPHMQSLDNSSLSEDRHSGSMYRSTPDLAHGGGAHRRYSSTDSMDGSHHSGFSGHSRQGSDSQEVNYPTRRLSTQSSRKSSTSADPLQFVKMKGAQDLAHTAEVQMRVAAESKKEATFTRAKDDDVDWQANLSSWKNRRKSQSERTYQLKEELEQAEKDKDRGQGSALQAKTYSQMKEERERRRSTGQKFYPIEDEEDEDTFLPSTETRSQINQLQNSRLESTKSTDGVAPWAVDSDEEGDEKKSRQSRKKDDDQNNNKSNNYSNNIKDDKDAEENVRRPLSSSRSRLSQKFKTFDEDENDTNYSKPSNTENQSRRSGAPEVAPRSSRRQINNDEGEEEVTLRRLGGRDRSEKFQRNGIQEEEMTSKEVRNQEKESPNRRRSEPVSKQREFSPRNDFSTDRDGSGVSKLTTTRSVGSRTQSKIGSIMKNFEESSSKPAQPKEGYNESIDLRARKSAFENMGRDNSRSNLPSGKTGYSHMESSSEDEEEDVSDEEITPTTRHQQSSAPRSGISSSSPAAADTSSRSPGSRQTPATSAAVPKQPPPPLPSSLEPPSQPDEKHSDKKFVEKNITISQKANSDRGFGFFLTGGVDTGNPLSVSKVALGSAADVCDLKVKDIIQQVNQTDVTAMTATQVGDLVAKGVQAGFIQLLVKRELGEDDLEDEEFDSSSDEGEEDLDSPKHIPSGKDFDSPQYQTSSKDLGPPEYQTSGTGDLEEGTTSVMDQLAAERAWLEQQMEAAENQDKADTHVTDQTKSQETDRGKKDVPIKPWETPSGTTVTSTSYSNTKLSKNLSMGAEDDADGSDQGPPAILRRWQRQRQKDEYTFDGGADVSDTYKRISLNTGLPRRDSDAANVDERTKDQEPKAGVDQTYGGHLGDWSRKQEQEKQEEPVTEPVMDTQKLLEERRAERRARIFQSVDNATPSSTTSSSYSFQPEPAAAPAPSSSHTTAMTFDVTPRQQYQPSNLEPSSTSYRVPAAMVHGLVIDPRNKQGLSEMDTPVHLQIQTNSQPFVDNTAALLEAERERIRQEELRKIEEERQRLEEERRARDEEERRRIKEQEEQIMREKEKLQQEKEKLLREREEFQRLRDQQQVSERKEYVQQYEPVRKHTEEYGRDQPQRSYASVPSSMPRHEQPTHSTIIHSSPSRPQYQQQPAFTVTVQRSPKTDYHQTPHEQPDQRSHSYQQQEWRPNETQRSQRSSSGLPSWPPNAGSTATSGDSEAGREGRKFSREAMLAMNRKATPMQTLPASQQDFHGQGQPQEVAPITREAPSRGEIHSLNSVPRAKLKKDSDWYNSSSSASSSHSNQSRSPVQRRERKEGMASMTGGRSISLANPGDHWLVEEAERRRSANQGAYLSGPIKPAGDTTNRWRDNSGYGSDQNRAGQAGRTPASMPHAIRQTLLQKTAGVRSADESVMNANRAQLQSSPRNVHSSVSPQSSFPHQSQHSPQSSRSLSPGDHTHYNQQQPERSPRHTHPHGQSSNYPPPQGHVPPPQGHYPPRTGENGVAVSGSQMCSNCNQELGFGAAMVIESLGLYYHVQCFRCCVCHASLGTGAQGADVRVRMNKLHCPNCYSNDEAGLKFSKV